MLSKKQLELLTPYGYEVTLSSVKEYPGEGYDILLTLRHDKRRNLNLRMMLPVGKGNFIVIAGRDCAVLSSITEFGRRNPVEVISDLLQQALEVSLADFVHRDGPPPDGEVVMSEFSRLVAASPMVLKVSCRCASR